MLELISSKIKEARKDKGITQAELADGICTQAMISNFEKGESVPSSIVLFKIAQKLKLDINYFFGQNSMKTHHDDNEETKKLIRKLIRNRDYQAINYIVKTEKEKANFSSNEDKQFLLWHEGICDFYLNKDSVNAIDILNTALKLTGKENYSEQTISINNSIAIIYFEVQQYENSLEFFQKCKSEYDLSNLKDSVLKIRILYGLSKTLVALKREEEAILECKKAIKICVTEESLYLLGELYFQIGRNLVILDRVKESEQYFEKAQHIFEIEGNYEFLDVIEKVKLDYFTEKR
ncbi:helix-turn-helix domain-containing protein [Lysinibacillus sp. NPDC097279]|uniref:helix-turn-helix domain-containing protein n=1 Tax=Lysinibacillus sp. NPDC097279 TaxID=3364143 RepID=UPI00380CEE40